MPRGAPITLFALGFAAGVPLPLVAGQVLRQWFTESGLSLSAIGLTALIGLAYANKFLWAPVLDAARPPLLARFGQRRGWLVLLQAALILGIAALGQTDPATGAALTVAVAVLVATLSASQDIVVDALRIELLPPDPATQARGLAAYVWGYRAALLASGAGTLLLVDALGWGGAHLVAAALLLPGLVAVLRLREPARHVPAISGWRARLRHSVADPFRDVLRRRYAVAILLFIALFRLGEALAGIMTVPFYNALGFARAEWVPASSFGGAAATAIGALAGAVLVARIGTGRALVATAMGQMLSNVMYVVLHGAGHSMPVLWAQVAVEGFTDGLADAAFLTYLSGLVNRSFTATQYALLSSLAAVPLRTLGATSGWLAQGLGWPGFFLLTSAAALPAMAIMLFLLRRLPPDQPAADPTVRPSA